MKARSNKGFSLIESMISVGVVGLLSVFVMQNFSNAADVQQSVEISLENDNLTQYIGRATNCQSTLPVPCAPGSSIALKNGVGTSIQTIVSNDPSNPTKIGKFTVVARCSTSGEGIVIRALRLKPGKAVTSTNSLDYFPHPLTKKSATFTSNESLLFPQNFELCSSIKPKIASVGIPTNCVDTAVNGTGGCSCPNVVKGYNWGYGPASSAYAFGATCRCCDISFSP